MMLKDCLEVFEQELKQKGMALIFDNYIPVDGSYLLVPVKDDGFGEPTIIEVKQDKKAKELAARANPKFRDICRYDFYSKLRDMNKPVDKQKIIHSNNYCSFFVKKESLKGGKLTSEGIVNYYDTLKDFSVKYAKKSKSLELYQAFEEKNGPVDCTSLEKAKTWILQNIFSLEKWCAIEGKDYLKIFFEFPLAVYEQEFERYLYPTIYNKNDFNIKTETGILGLPNQNMSMNDKKPFLENKSRKTKIPYLISIKEAILQLEFFEYLLSFADRREFNIYIDPDTGTIQSYQDGKCPAHFSGYFLRIQKGKEGAEIHRFDVISGYYEELSKSFEQNNHLHIKRLEDYPYGSIWKRREMEDLLEKYLFPFLSNNYFTPAKDVPLKDSIEKQLFVLTRDSLFEWLYKGNAVLFRGLYDQVVFLLLRNSLLKGNVKKAAHQFNLWLSLKIYFEGGENMGDRVNEIKKNLKQKMYAKETDQIQSDHEYYFVVGQLIYYLFSKSQSKKIPQSLLNGFLTVKTDRLLKEKLEKLYMKYNYDITIYEKRFNHLYAMATAYEPGNHIVDRSMLINGFLHSNLFYEKKEEIENE